ncbi:MAG: PAS domain-containing protein [Alphaproteobacteria bacterium]|jgi:hypothetical protein|nr:PAS domain-containing protein [Alphaproteobacteria bacterium]
MTSPQLMSDPRSLLEATFDVFRNKTPSMQMIDRIYDNVPAPLIITKPSLQNRWPRIVYVNRHFCDLYAYSREGLIKWTTKIFSGDKTDLSTIAEMRNEIRADRICRVPMITYNSEGREQKVRIEISRLALDPSPAVDLWIALHIPMD